MLLNEKLDIFLNPELSCFIFHPLVAPIYQLFQSYLKNDIIEFDKKKKSVLEYLNFEEINNFLLIIRNNFFINNLIFFCKPYNIISFEFIQKELNCNENNIINAVEYLIFNQNFDFLIDNINKQLFKISNKINNDLIDCSNLSKKLEKLLK